MQAMPTNDRHQQQKQTSADIRAVQEILHQRLYELQHERPCVSRFLTMAQIMAICMAIKMVFVFKV